MYTYTEAEAADFIRAGIQIPLGFHPVYCQTHYVNHAGKATGGTGHDPVERGGQWVCRRCGLVMPAPHLQAHPEPDTLTIAKPDLEAALRDCWDEAERGHVEEQYGNLELIDRDTWIATKMESFQ